MLTIRFNRVGKKNKAQFRIVVQEHSVAPGGRHIEVLGSYNPHSKEVFFKEDRIKYWISKGAQASVSVHNILVEKGVLDGKKIAIKMRKKKNKEETENKEEKKEGDNEKSVEKSKKKPVKEGAKPEEKDSLKEDIKDTKEKEVPEKKEEKKQEGVKKEVA